MDAAQISQGRRKGAERLAFEILDLDEELGRGERLLSLTSEKHLTRLARLLDLPCISTDLHGDILGVYSER